MFASRHRFTAFTTALVVLVAHVLCVCRGASVAAGVPVNEEPASHRCCKHEAQPAREPASHQPTHDSDGRCHHCDGLAATAPGTADQGAIGKHPAFQFSALPAIDAADGVALDCSGVSSAFPHSALLSSPTLLRLSCALNL
jgi:hypothetical protein